MSLLRLKFIVCACAVTSMWSTLTTTANAAPPIVVSEFEKLQELCRPSQGEADWRQIPWRTDLWSALAEASAAGKPVLLWEMDGHPLGCT